MGLKSKKQVQFSIRWIMMVAVVLMCICAFVLILFHWKTAVNQSLNHIESIQKHQNIQVLNTFENKFSNIKNSINASVSYLENNTSKIENEAAIKDMLLLLSLNEKSLAVLSFADKNNNYYSVFRLEGSTDLMFAKADASGVMVSGPMDYGLQNPHDLRTSEGFFAGKRPWFQQAQGNSELVWSTIYQYHSSKSFAVGASKAVFNEGEFQGVVAADYFLEDLSQVLHEASGDQSGLLMIFDYSHNVIADNLTPDDSGLAMLKSNVMSAVSQIFGLSQGSQQLAMNVDGLLINRLQIDLTGSKSYWLINVLSEQRYLAQVHQQARNILWASLFILVVGILVFYLFTAVISKSLKQLEVVSKRMSKGDWDGELPVSHIKEITSLSQAYNYMSHQIKLTLDNLESKVQSRTKNLNKLNKRLKISIVTDPLTGVGNRRYFNQIMNSVSESKEPFTLVIVDVDYFKKFNDKHGHLAGDEALVVIGQKFKSTFSDKNTHVARIGGEEFAIICSQSEDDVFVQKLQQFQKAVKNQKLSLNGVEIDCQLTVSMGICISHVNDVHWNHTYAQADKALYKAKSSGRNCIANCEFSGGHVAYQII